MSSWEEGQHRQTQMCGGAEGLGLGGGLGVGWERRLRDPQAPGSHLTVTAVLVRTQPQPLATAFCMYTMALAVFSRIVTPDLR